MSDPSKPYTWGDLKREVEAAGATDETPIHYVDFVWAPGTVRVDTDGHLEVY